MPMRGELAAPALRVGSQTPANELFWRQIAEGLCSIDLLVVIVFSVIGLLISLLLMSLLPFAADVATGLALLS